MKKIALIVLVIILTSCASTKEAGPYGESGDVWCNKPFLRSLPPAFGEPHLTVAKQGYIYSVAAALVLQGESKEDHEHYFKTPQRLRKVDQPKRHKSGFEVATYELYKPDSQQLQEVIVAFTGSNDRADWVLTNLLFSKDQYDLARKYVKGIAGREEYKQIPITVTGYSLGGGLAVHVAKSPETSQYISKVWAFNPSPKIYAHGEIDNRIWLAAVEGEALAKLRSPKWRFWPGISNIGSPPTQTAENYYLIRSNSIYGHFRWVLARNMLHAADLGFYLDGKEQNEALDILRNSHFSSCHNNDITLNKAIK